MPAPDLRRRAAGAIAAVTIEATDAGLQAILVNFLSVPSWHIEARCGSFAVVECWRLCDSLNDGQTHRLPIVRLGLADLPYRTERLCGAARH